MVGGPEQGGDQGGNVAPLQSGPLRIKRNHHADQPRATAIPRKRSIRSPNTGTARSVMKSGM